MIRVLYPFTWTSAQQIQPKQPEVVGGGWYVHQKRPEYEAAREARKALEAKWRKRKKMLALAAMAILTKK